MNIKDILDLASSGVGLVNSIAGRGGDSGPATSTFQKGIEIAKTLIEAGQDAAPAVEVLIRSFSKNKTDVTQAELERTEAELDRLLDEFNTEMPEG